MLNLDFTSEKEEHTSIDFDYALKQVQRSLNRQLIHPNQKPNPGTTECGINLSLSQQSQSINGKKHTPGELSEEIVVGYIKQPSRESNEFGFTSPPVVRPFGAFFGNIFSDLSVWCDKA